jgi:2-polyprenyl-3-methyl-5-hydroxy-6-metoxy-1,4-benzoquinol methylase
MVNACPICDAAGSKALFMRRSPFPAARDALYQVRECSTCGHRWCAGDVSPELLGAIYRGSFHNSSQQTAADLSAPVMVNARTRAQWLVGQGLGGRLLDIGAGKGYFVRAAGDAGFQAEGIELSGEAAMAARAMGAAVRQGNFQTDQAEMGSFDVITLWDVLAGMPDPDVTIARVSDLLAGGGHTILTVPDGCARSAKMQGRFWHLLTPPVQLHFFSRTGMSLLLRRHGLELIGYAHRSKRVSLRFAAQKVARVLHFQWLEKLVVSAIPVGWSIRLNLGDIATVVARKLPVVP